MNKNGHVNFVTALSRINDPHSCFELVHCKRHVALPPRFIGKVREGVCEQLDCEVLLYSTLLQGVFIGYKNIKLIQTAGLIMDDEPFIHFDIELDVIVFKPTIGCMLKATVNKVSVDHVGCLVQGHFNVSLPRPRESNGKWKGSELKLEDECIFVVDNIYTRNRVLSMQGHLHKKLSGHTSEKLITEDRLNNNKDTENDEEETKTDSSVSVPVKKKHKKSSKNSEEIVEDVRESVPEKKKKKKKKHKHKHD